MDLFGQLISGTYCLTTGIVLTNNLGDYLSIEIAQTIEFRECPLIRFVRTVDVWCKNIIGIVHSNEPGDCQLIGYIVLANDFTGGLLTGMA